MITGDQSGVIDFLTSSSTYGGAPVERIDTHTAIVFLAGERAYKLKRAVLFDYLDFSTPERRRQMCDAELRLNRRTAPRLYLRVLPVTRERGGWLALHGAGEAVDWVIEMHRFPQDALFDRRAAAGRLDLELMPPLASAIARFHMAAEPRPDHGGTAGMAWVIDGNAAGFAEFGRGALESGACRELHDLARAALERCGPALDERRAAGWVRHCHGDLHLRNIVLLDGQPTLFDGVEFDDRIACIDVLYDLAFLLMDLRRRHLPRQANAVWNRYLAEMGTVSGVSLVPLFLSCRAAVRAKTSVTAAAMQPDAPRRDELHAAAREYLAMATAFLRPPRPRLVAIGGFSGTGKSTLAHGLAPSVGAAPGAVVIRTDEIRKRLAGVAPLQPLDAGAYTQDMSGRVYAAAAEGARAVLREGHSVIVDAVFARASDRDRVERLAREMSVPFAGIWLEAPAPVLIARVESRHGDASDANADVIRTQQRQPTGAIAWHRIDASPPPEEVLDRVRELRIENCELRIVN